MKCPFVTTVQSIDRTINWIHHLSNKRTLDYISILCIKPNDILLQKCKALLIEQKNDKNASPGSYGEFKATEVTHLGRKVGIILYGKTHDKFWVKIIINSITGSTLMLLDQKIEEVLEGSPYMIEDFDIRLVCTPISNPIQVVKCFEKYTEVLGFNSEAYKYQGLVQQIDTPVVKGQNNPNAFVNGKRVAKRGRNLLLYAARKDGNDRGVKDEQGNQFEGELTHFIAEIKNRKQHMGEFTGGYAWRTCFVAMVRERLAFLSKPFKGKGRNRYNHFTFANFEQQLDILAKELSYVEVDAKPTLFYVQDIITGRPNEYRKKLASLSLMLPYLVNPVAHQSNCLARFDLTEFDQKRSELPWRFKVLLNRSSKECVNQMCHYYLDKGHLKGFWLHWLLIQVKRRSERLNVPIDEMANILKPLFKENDAGWRELNWLSGSWITSAV